MYIEKLNKTHLHEPESFWANTSGNDIIYRYIKEANPKMREEFDILVSGGVIEKPIKDTITYREMDQINNVYSFLLFTGYLKAIKCVDNEKGCIGYQYPIRKSSKSMCLYSVNGSMNR